MSGRLRHVAILFHVVVHEVQLGRVAPAIDCVLAALVVVGAPVAVKLVQPVPVRGAQVRPVEGRRHADLVGYFDLPREAGVVQAQVLHRRRVLDDERLV